jgi:hypothetical protein
MYRRNWTPWHHHLLLLDRSIPTARARAARHAGSLSLVLRFVLWLSSPPAITTLRSPFLPWLDGPPIHHWKPPCPFQLPISLACTTIGGRGDFSIKRADIWGPFLFHQVPHWGMGPPCTLSFSMRPACLYGNALLCVSSSLGSLQWHMGCSLLSLASVLYDGWMDGWVCGLYLSVDHYKTINVHLHEGFA